MVVKQHQRFVLQDKSFANLIKRDITRIAESYGFSEADVGKINIIVSELISNLLKYTPEGGELLVKAIGKHGIEILCIDKGPGMQDPNRMMNDGTSTSGTAGEGLGAIKRLSNEFDLYSQPGQGTIILSRLFKAHKKEKVDILARENRFEIVTVMVPKHNEQLCGDGCAMVIDGNNCYLIVLDGLGHGASANEASFQAADSFLARHALEPAANLRLIHKDIRKTRGAVGSIIHVSTTRKKLSYCGIGNITGKLYTLNGAVLSNAASRNIISYNGIIGHNIPATFSSQLLDWNSSNLMVLHSDGILTRWDLSKYPNLHRHNSSIMAAVIYRDYCRHTDDSLVVIVRPKA